MRVVLDANIAASALIRPEGWTARQLEREDVTWLVPAFLFDELRAHEETYAAKAKVDRDRWQDRVQRFASTVEEVPDQALLAAGDHDLVARAEAVDPDDGLYLACVVAAEADLLWTRDGALLDGFPGLAVRVVPRPPGHQE